MEETIKKHIGKTVYVGIDVHKKTYSVVCLCENEIVKRDSLVASPERLVEYLHKYFPGAKIETAYEAGFSGFHLHRYLKKHGIKNKVVHPASIEISARDRVKTDKRDALKIAVQLAAGRLNCIHIPSEEREGYRQITRLREKMVNARKAVGNQIKSILFQYGLIAAEDDRKVSSKWIKEVLTISINEDTNYCLKTLCEQWQALCDKTDEINKKLSEQAKKDEAINTIYQSAPGIGTINARILANELEDMSQFSNEKKLYSYTGLTPCEYSSGEHVRRGHISRQGKPILRKVLVQASWVAIKIGPSLKTIYERISNKAGAKRAIIAIARRLIGRIKNCFDSGTLYQVAEQATE